MIRRTKSIIFHGLQFFFFYIYIIWSTFNTNHLTLGIPLGRSNWFERWVSAKKKHFRFRFFLLVVVWVSVSFFLSGFGIWLKIFSSLSWRNPNVLRPLFLYSFMQIDVHRYVVASSLISFASTDVTDNLIRTSCDFQNIAREPRVHQYWTMDMTVFL